MAETNKEYEKKLASWCNQKFKDAMSAKEKFAEEWMNYLNAWNNSLFEDQSVPKYRSNYTTNYIYSTIESMRPIMFDGNIKFEAIPTNKEAMQYCDAINTAFDFEFQRTNMKQKLIANSIYTFCIGTSVFMLPYVYSDKATDGIDGDVEPIPINPFNLFPDPLATCVEDAEFIIYATYKHMNVLKKEYPERAEEISGADIQYDELVNSRNEGWKVNNQVLVLEVWCRDYTQIEVEEEEGGTSKVPKYPTGRVIICAPELNMILEDKENPYETGRFPFFLFKDIDVPFQFWGEGEVKWLLSPQKAINDLQNQIIDNAKHTANAVWILDKNCGIPKGDITNRPGLVIRKNPGSEVRRETPPTMPMYVSEQLGRLTKSMEDVSGVHDITRGQTPTGIESGTAIQILQEAGQTRIRLKITLFEEAMGKLGTEWLARMKQFWKSDRLIPVKNSYSESLPTYGLNGMEMQPQANPQMMAGMQDPMQMMQTQMGMPTEGNLTPLQEFDFVTVGKDQIKQDYRIQIVSNSSMQVSKSALLDILLNMMKFQAEDGMPVVPREAILDCLPNVNKQVILDYFDKLKQEQMQMQQQQMMNNQAMQQLQAVSQSVDGLNKRAEDEDRKMMQDNFLTQGYQQGMSEGMLMAKQQDRQGDIPPALLEQMANMSDAELAAFLQQNPELANIG